jgi:hypothetical protein
MKEKINYGGNMKEELLRIANRSDAVFVLDAAIKDVSDEPRVAGLRIWCGSGTFDLVTLLESVRESIKREII